MWPRTKSTPSTTSQLSMRIHAVPSDYNHAHVDHRHQFSNVLDSQACCASLLLPTRRSDVQVAHRHARRCVVFHATPATPSGNVSPPPIALDTQVSNLRTTWRMRRGEKWNTTTPQVAQGHKCNNGDVRCAFFPVWLLHPRSSALLWMRER